MVKAQAYGHGMERIAQFSFFEKGIHSFGVATPQEATALKMSLGEEQVRVLVFSGPPLQEVYTLYLEKNLIPVIFRLDDLRFFLRNIQGLPLFVKFNTGMNRLGIHWERIGEVCALLRKYGRKCIDHLMSHFANASLPMSQKLNVLQRKRFDNLKREFRGSGVDVNETSMANSATLEQGLALRESHIRPGLILYGPSALEGGHRFRGQIDTKIISTLKARVLEVHETNFSDPIGYGGTPCREQGQVAIASIGYADGLLRAYEGGIVPYKGRNLEIFGKVSMDMVHLFCPGNGPSPKVGEEVTLWSKDNFEDLSKHSGLSPYEMFCSVGRRLPRIYDLE